MCCHGIGIAVSHEFFHIDATGISSQYEPASLTPTSGLSVRAPSVLKSIVVYLIYCLVLAVSWSIMFVFDGTVFGLTLRQAIHYHLWSHSLATLMLKDGRYPKLVTFQPH